LTLREIHDFELPSGCMCDTNEGDIVVVNAQNAYGEHSKHEGKLGLVVSTTAGIIPGLYTWVIFEPAGEQDKRKWHPFAYGGVTVLDRENYCMACPGMWRHEKLWR